MDGEFLPYGFMRMLEDAQRDFEEVQAGSAIRDAERLVARTGIDLDTRSYPMYFTGDVNARIALVHLNPKQHDRLSRRQFASFEEYVDRHRRFGHYHWDLDPTYRSAFDHKQVRFLRPFGVIDFLPDDHPDARRRNPELAIDQKLQLELVPYGSANFPTHRFSEDVLRPYMDRLITVLMSCQPRYILFCGAVFEDLLARSGRLWRSNEFRFQLPTTKGISKNEYVFSNVEIACEGGVLRAGVARSFAIQGLPMAAYAEKCRELYDIGCS